MFLKNKNIIFKIRRSKVKDCAALKVRFFLFLDMIIAPMKLVRALIQHARSLIYELVKRDQRRLSRACAFA